MVCWFQLSIEGKNFCLSFKSVFYRLRYCIGTLKLYRFPREGGLYNVKLVHYNGSAASEFEKFVQVNVTQENQSFSTLHRLHIDGNNNSPVNVSITATVEGSGTKVCILISFDDVMEDLMIYRDVTDLWCKSTLQRYTPRLGQLELSHGSSSVLASHLYTWVGYACAFWLNYGKIFHR